jgi:hypothetical protein
MPIVAMCWGQQHRPLWTALLACVLTCLTGAHSTPLMSTANGESAEPPLSTPRVVKQARVFPSSAIPWCPSDSQLPVRQVMRQDQAYPVPCSPASRGVGAEYLMRTSAHMQTPAAHTSRILSSGHASTKAVWWAGRTDAGPLTCPSAPAQHNSTGTGRGKSQAAVAGVGAQAARHR